MSKHLLLLLTGFTLPLAAQIPVEVFVGQQRSTIDIMFFKFFKTPADEPSRWLFFNRTRAAIDYRMTSSSYLPQFGLTEAISYNHPKWRGFAPVGVGQVLSTGLYTKAGVQFAHIGKEVTIFSWLVSETRRNPEIDYFLLFRYTPQGASALRPFLQAESLNTFPMDASGSFSFVQRFRLGIRLHAFQAGIGFDQQQSGRSNFQRTHNRGGFIRYEF